MEFNILGRSNSTISMILETLFQIYGSGIKVKIIENMESGDGLPFGIDGIETLKILDNCWDYENDIKRQIPTVLGVYKPKTKMAVYNYYRERYGIPSESYINIIDPSVIIARTVAMRNGITLGPASIIAPYAEIHDMVTLNRKVTIGHHTKIYEFCTINPGVNVAGRCSTGQDALHWYGGKYSRWD